MVTAPRQSNNRIVYDLLSAFTQTNPHETGRKREREKKGGAAAFYKGFTVLKRLTF